MSGGGGYQPGQPSQQPGGLQPLQMLQSFRQGGFMGAPYQNMGQGGLGPMQSYRSQQGIPMPPSYGYNAQAPMTGGKFGGAAPMQNANGMGMPEFGSAAQSSPQQGQTPRMTGGK